MLIGETTGMKRVIADRGYDANRIRAALREQGTMFCRVKDFPRIATRCDKLARNFLSAASLAAAVAFRL